MLYETIFDEPLTGLGQALTAVYNGRIPSDPRRASAVLKVLEAEHLLHELQPQEVVSLRLVAGAVPATPAPAPKLTPAQLARQATKAASDARKAAVAAALLAGGAELSNRQLATMHRVSPATVAAVRAQLVAGGKIADTARRTDALGRQQPARRRK